MLAAHNIAGSKITAIQTSFRSVVWISLKQKLKGWLHIVTFTVKDDAGGIDAADLYIAGKAWY